MVGQRNRIVELENFLKKSGIEVNIGKNKARGNKGFFKAAQNVYRIDIAKGLTEKETICVLVHEFMHFLHYRYDKTLTSLDFIFDEISDDVMEELLAVTVKSIPKSSVEPLFKLKTELKTEIKGLAAILSSTYPDFKLDVSFKVLESKILKTPQKYLLKYDKVKVNEGFTIKVYSIDSLDSYNELNEDLNLYLKIKSKQRALKRITSRISRLNKYYNAPTELLARTIETYVFDSECFSKEFPLLKSKIDKVLENNRIPLFTELINISL